jgi:isopenicillin N synthase-like dioxygenase
LLTRSAHRNLNFYPPYSSIPPERRQEVERGFVRGLNAHRDFHTWLSILIQDESGLEVLSHDGKWIDVPVIPGTVVVNTGSMLMEATNGALPATIHRVNSLKVRKPRMTAPCGFTIASRRILASFSSSRIGPKTS